MGCEHSNDMYNINTYDLNAISQEETATEEIQEDDQTDDEEIANNCLKIIETNDGYYNVVINPIQIVTSFLECFAKNDENGGVMKQNLLMTNIQHELLVFGYIRTNAIYNIPNVLIRLCVAYYAAKTNNMLVIGNKLCTCSQYPCLKNTRVFEGKPFEIKGFKFILKVHQQKCFFYYSIVSLSSPKKVSTFTIVYKMYCPQTDTSYHSSKTFGGLCDTCPLKCTWPESLSCFDYYNKNELQFICEVELLNYYIVDENKYQILKRIHLAQKCSAQ
eukprot:267398_1